MDWYDANVQEFLRKVLNGVFLLLVLNFIYFISFKLIRWKSLLLKVVLSRTRLPVYILMNIFLLMIFAGFFPPTRFSPIISRLIDVLSVLLGGVILIEIVNAGIFDYFLPRVGKQDTLPIYRHLLIAVAYILVIYGILGWLLHIDVPHLLTTSAILTVVLGLALQDTLGNLFSGLALNISRPYQVGDWVKFGEYDGKVMSIDWRAVSILTTADTTVNMPNSTLAKLPILNYSSPTPIHVRTLELGVDYRHPPNKVRDTLLDVLHETAGVLDKPAPRIRLFEFSEFRIMYRMVFWIDDFGNFAQISTDILEKIWYKFRREGIEIPLPQQSLRLTRPKLETSIMDRVRLLKSIDFLSLLDESQLEYLAGRLKLNVYSNGEKICAQDETGDTFYIVRSGKVSVTAVNTSGETYLSKEVREGSFFGEISLLTGEPRSATVTAMGDVELFTMTKEDLRYLITSNPKVGELISDSLARRQEHSISALEKAKDAGGEVPECTGQIDIKQAAEEFLKKISYFFSY